MAGTVTGKAMSEHKELAAVYVCAAIAAIMIRYVASVQKPGVFDAILALLAVGAIVGAYLSVARSDAGVALKAGTIISAAVVGGAFLGFGWLLF